MSKSRDEIDRLKQPREHDQVKATALGPDAVRESADKELLTAERRNKQLQNGCILDLLEKRCSFAINWERCGSNGLTFIDRNGSLCGWICPHASGQTLY